MTERSNDLLADRRFAWASAMLEQGDFGAAADLFGQVVERVPAWAPGWAALGQARERAHEPALALQAWQRAAALDGGRILGADLHVARLAGHAPRAMPAAYVQALFDAYAPRFERHLVEGLGYCGPGLLIEAFAEAAAGTWFDRALDLGCGTGLMGRALAGMVRRIDGVDLAPRMVEAARASGAYDEVIAGPLETIVATAEAGSYDLVLAADVLAYLGDLRPLMSGVARVLAPGGLFGFTVQLQSQGGRPEFALGPDLRFAHTQAYVEARLAGAGLAPVFVRDASARQEHRRPVPGLVVVARRGAGGRTNARS